jgi:hypothetical protein
MLCDLLIAAGSNRQIVRVMCVLSATSTSVALLLLRSATAAAAAPAAVNA